MVALAYFVDGVLFMAGAAAVLRLMGWHRKPVGSEPHRRDANPQVAVEHHHPGFQGMRIRRGRDGEWTELLLDSTVPEFARGIEVGMAVGRLMSMPLPVAVLMHASNAEMALRLGEMAGVPVRSEDVGGDWLKVVFGEPSGI